MLPDLLTEEAVDAWFEEDSSVSDAVAHVGRIRGRNYEQFSRGSMLVLGDDDEVVKLFPPGCAGFHAIEWAALCALDGSLPVPTPAPRESFLLDGWHGIAMSRLRGQELVDVWPGLTPESKQDLGRQLGEALAVLHQLEPPGGIPRVDWPAWVSERRGRIVGMQRSRGCREEWLSQIPGFLETADLEECAGYWFGV